MGCLFSEGSFNDDSWVVDSWRKIENVEEIGEKVGDSLYTENDGFMESMCPVS